MLSRYASNTTVSVARSKAEIEELLCRHGASQFAQGWNEGEAVLCFALGRRAIRMALPLPDKGSDEFWFTPSRRNRRDHRQAMQAWEQACRSRWRALLLVIRAKLEAVEVGISTIEEEFLAWTVVPGSGQTVIQEMGAALTKAIEEGERPLTLIGGCAS